MGRSVRKLLQTQGRGLPLGWCGSGVRLDTEVTAPLSAIFSPHEVEEDSASREARHGSLFLLKMIRKYRSNSLSPREGITHSYSLPLQQHCPPLSPRASRMPYGHPRHFPGTPCHSQILSTRAWHSVLSHGFLSFCAEFCLTPWLCSGDQDPLCLLISEMSQIRNGQISMHVMQWAV